MERSACHVIYVNRNVAQDRLVSVVGVDGPLPKDSTPEWTLDQARQDIQPVLDAFGDGKLLRRSMTSNHLLMILASSCLRHWKSMH